MRIRIVQSPTLSDVDGVDLDGFTVGGEYEVGNSVGALLLAEGWAEPVALDAPKAPEAFGVDDLFGTTTIDRSDPPNLVKEQHPPFLDRDLAHDIASTGWRSRRRRRR